MASSERRQKTVVSKPERREEEERTTIENKTSIQLTAPTRDRLFRLKFRRTYDQFLNELCDLYEQDMAEKK
jgi:hypothetical protein